MKNFSVALLLLLAPACYGHALPHDFRFTLEHPRMVQATTGDDLAQALANHGLDANLAPLVATGIEILIKNNNDLLARLTTDEAAITKLQQQVAALTPPAAKGQPFAVAADRCVASATCPGAATQDTLALDGNKIFLTTGQTYDYAVTLTVAGNYVLAARVCNSQGSAGVTTVHFEFPAGTPIGGPLTLPAAQQWTTLSTPAVPLPAGALTLRLVVDASATPIGNGGLLDAISGTPQ